MRHHSRQRDNNPRQAIPLPQASHAIICRSTHLSVQEVSSHEKLQGNFRLDGELGDLGRAVGVAQLVVEILDDLLKDGSRDLAEVDLTHGLLVNVPGPDNMDLMVPETMAALRSTTNSW